MLRIINLPKENECVLEENRDTGIHNRLLCRRWQDLQVTQWGCIYNLTAPRELFMQRWCSNVLHHTSWSTVQIKTHLRAAKRSNITLKRRNLKKKTKKLITGQSYGTHEALRILQTESTWRQWGNQKPAWSQGRARLGRLQREIIKGGALSDSMQRSSMGVCYNTNPRRQYEIRAEVLWKPGGTELNPHYKWRSVSVCGEMHSKYTPVCPMQPSL